MSGRSQLALAAVAFAITACADAPTAPPKVNVVGPNLALLAGTWELYPSQTTYATSVQQPINDDGSSSFKSTPKGVIPVKFSLSSGVNAAVFESICPGNPTPSSCNPALSSFSFLSFTPATATTFSQITNLASAYVFSVGDCHGGSLRWQVRLSTGPAIFIYYGAHPNFTDCTTASQTGVNLIGLPDLRYDTSQLPGGTFYDSYAHALTLAGSTTIVRASLILDSGWGGAQRLTLGSATVNDNTFTPAPASPLGPTCNLPTAEIRVTKTAGASSGPVNEPTSTQAADDNSIFRQVDCKYMYNLSMSSLSGTGTYKVEAVIDGNGVASPATFVLR
ncbi:MAG TPA: hypothetical protein VM076_06870 [Gemmatimonadaceae bacterium]|nr:hypothetical protein [Gemmatimonadaceae bacterium]